MTQLAGNLRREFLIWRSYGFNAITSLLMWAIIFPLLVAIMQNVARRNGATFGRDELIMSLVGFLAWRLTSIIITELPSSIEVEARTGTLENTLLSSNISIIQQVIIRAITRSVFATVETLVLALSMGLLFQVIIPLSPQFLLLTLMMLLGMWGVGFVATGLTLIYKSGVITIMTLIANLALLIALIPVYALGWFFLVSRAIFPLIWGIDLLRQTIEGNITGNEVLGFSIQTILFFVGGLAIFNWCFQEAKKRGELSAY